MTNPAFDSVIVFTRTKHGADAVTCHLAKIGYLVATIHGNKAQGDRQSALKAFRARSVQILIATDTAARGIDIPGISHVINYDLPDEAENYVHRIGRTGRNGAFGEALTLFDEKIEKTRLCAVERLIRMKLVSESVPERFAAFPEKLNALQNGEEENNNERRLKKSIP